MIKRNFFDRYILKKGFISIFLLMFSDFGIKFDFKSLKNIFFCQFLAFYDLLIGLFLIFNEINLTKCDNLILILFFKYIYIKKIKNYHFSNDLFVILRIKQGNWVVLINVTIKLQSI